MLALLSYMILSLGVLVRANPLRHPPIWIHGCTTTTINTIVPQPAPELWRPTWTITAYPSTVTASTGVDCHGCTAITTQDLFVDVFYRHGPPHYVHITAAAPTTVTQAYCTPVSPACTSTLTRADAQFTFGPTKTVYTTTETVTSSVDCGGCQDLVVSSWMFGHGPAVIFNATTTAVDPSQTTVFACGATETTTADPQFTLY